MTRRKPVGRLGAGDDKPATSASNESNVSGSGATVPTVLFKPGKAARKQRRQMRRHPVFRDVLRAYVQCKRPVVASIPPLDQSEEVLFKEFAEEDHHLLRDDDESAGTDEDGAEDEIPEAEMSTFLNGVLSTLQIHRQEIEALIRVRESCCEQYAEFLKTTWLEKLQQDPSAEDSADTETPGTAPHAPRPGVAEVADGLMRRRKKEEAESDRAVEKRRRENLPTDSVNVLRNWMMENVKRPYPTDQDKADLAKAAGITTHQVSNWFVNARKRIWQTMLEAKYGEDGAHALMPSRPLRAMEIPQLGDVTPT
eukprot:CAMPEP_0202814878 /NCGR_PEP_ID=MMETSP1389-20130828/5903_1 /ASSEMBLY_ACC=CAM_ASM_000865 /TAXON_ID=302021 /ORGANISM="Rhodomonas sp., Strain CCMP768" /LENGTH=309 /DNA_ID=CAMNT_0049486743 /DNA_START=30 /DNA_END=959 /DNA_ORIENTATION=+